MMVLEKCAEPGCPKDEERDCGKCAEHCEHGPALVGEEMEGA